MNNKLFFIKEAIKVGWEKTKQNVGSFFLILLASWVVSGIISALSERHDERSALASLLALVGWIVGVFIQLGLTRVTLKVLDGGKPATSDFSFNADQFGRFLLGTILAGVIIAVGFVLFIIPGIILCLRLQFMPYLIVEKNMNPIDAMKRSWAISRNQTWNLFVFAIVCVLVGLLGLIAFVVGLIWAIPTVMIAGAFVYRKLESAVGSEVIPVESQAV